MKPIEQGATIGIAGAGSIAFATAVCLAQAGFRPVIWSPSGARTVRLAAGASLRATGAVAGEFAVGAATSAEDLVQGADAILIALPGYGHKVVLDAIAPHIRTDQAVIYSSHASFGALYLSTALAARGVTVPIVAWGTTIATARQHDMESVYVNTVRSKIDLCTVPEIASDLGLNLCQTLFGDRFVQRDGLLAISLSNLNPQNHMGIALCNMTRMERGETWGQSENITPNVGRLLEALDAERVAIASRLGLKVRTIFEHFHLSYHVPKDSVANMSQQIHRNGHGGHGPTTADSRYAYEDVPYGLLVTARIGKLVGQPALLHEAGVRVFSALYGRDFSAENTLLDALEFDRITLSELQEAVRTGVLPTSKPGT